MDFVGENFSSSELNDKSISPVIRPIIKLKSPDNMRLLAEGITRFSKLFDAH
jgi:hypothetical protein